MSRGTLPVPWYLGDRDYYPRNDPRRPAHIRHIDIQASINARIDAAAGDGSYSVVVRRDDV